ncbi:MFS transporter [Streptomyces sp. TRM66268-LWL]|uniref:MFS transporter n=1 Tax=Streptomyces polyasparticus TaxID=2767826 RepID=A0ABR7SNU9_9ACTN|nr:MFS transporter [Streptomyces polyasparticus]MBC9716247.1 MFS transporter [Streptomyces polyasparticus]
MKRTGAIGRRVPPLLRDQGFRRYWTGQTVSLVGDQISLIALPLAAVVVLGADAAEMGWLKTAELLPALLLNLPAGAWADRQAHRRRIMIFTDLARAALLFSLPVAYALDALTLPQLYVVALGVGALTVLFEVCNVVVFAALLPADRYVQGNSLVNGSRSMSWLGGPGLGGVLVAVLSAPVALLATGLTYLFSAERLARIAPAEPPPAEPEPGHFTAGIRWVLANPPMRAFFGAVATLQFFNFIFHTLFVLYATRELGLSAGMFGAVLSVAAVGGLAGAVGSGAVVRRIGIGPSIVLGCAAFTLPLLLVPLAGGPTGLVLTLLFVAEFVSSAGVMLLDIAAGSLQLALVPDGLRSRVLGAFRFLTHGFRPLGAVAGGFLGTFLGVRPALWIGTAGAALGTLWLLLSPIARIRDLPSAPAVQSETPDAAPATTPDAARGS